MNLSGPDQVDVITLALKQFNVIDQKNFLPKPSKKRLHTSDQKIATNCLGVLHQHSIESTNTNQIAKLRVKSKKFNPSWARVCKNCFKHSTKDFLSIYSLTC